MFQKLLCIALSFHLAMLFLLVLFKKKKFACIKMSIFLDPLCSIIWAFFALTSLGSTIHLWKIFYFFPILFFYIFFLLDALAKEFSFLLIIRAFKTTSSSRLITTFFKAGFCHILGLSLSLFVGLVWVFLIP